MLCPNCSSTAKPEAKFCGSCGSKLSLSSTEYPSVVISAPSALGFSICNFKLIETKGEGPDGDGDIRIELKYSVTNTTKQAWDYLAVTTQLVNFDGQVIEQSTDSFEQTLEPNDDSELDIYFGATNLKLLGQHPEKSVIVSTITACKSEFVSLGSIDIPAEAFQVTSIAPIRLGDTAQLLSGSVYKTEPDSDKDCQVQVKALIQNLTNLPLYEVKIIADVTDKSGRELCDAGGYEQLKPGELCLVQGNGYTKEKSLKAAKIELSIRSYTPVAVSTVQTNGLNLSESDSHRDDIDADDDESDNLGDDSYQDDSVSHEMKLNAAWEIKSENNHICRWFLAWNELSNNSIAGAIAGYSGGGSFEVERFYAKIKNNKINELWIDSTDRISNEEIDFDDLDSEIIDVCESCLDQIWEWNDKSTWIDNDSVILSDSKKLDLEKKEDLLLLTQASEIYLGRICELTGLTSMPSTADRNKRTPTKSQRKATFEFHIKRAVVNMDDLDDDIKDDVIKSLALIKKGQLEEAIAALPPFNFEWIWSNGDGDPSEFFIDTEDLTISLTPENSSIRVGETDGNLVLTVSIQFELALAENCNTDEINDWLSDNSMFFCGYIGCGWTYHGDDGGGITMLS